MTTRTLTCIAPTADRHAACGGPIRPSYIGTEPLGAAEVTRPAACEKCGKTYDDVVSVAMTSADLELVAQRLSESTRQALRATATEIKESSYAVELTEERARDLASKAANLGLAELASRVRRELTALSAQRRKS